MPLDPRKNVLDFPKIKHFPSALCEYQFQLAMGYNDGQTITRIEINFSPSGKPRLVTSLARTKLPVSAFQSFFQVASLKIG